MFSYSRFEHQEAKSHFVYECPLSEDYQVWVNGEEIPVYICQISKYPFNRVWPGYQRPYDQSETASFVNLIGDEKLEIEVCSRIEHKKVLLKPYSKNLEYKEADGKISFMIRENGNYVLECDSYHHCLYLFYSKPIPAPEKTEVTYYFGPGIHFPGRIRLKSNESVYADKDALIYGSVYGEEAENLHVFGNGIFDDSHEERTGNYCYEEYTNGNMRFYGCKNVCIEGVGMMNSAQWCLSAFGCHEVQIKNIKIFGQWRYNTDGIDLVNCQNVSLKDSFVHSFDDTIVIKGIDRYYDIDNKNIEIENCVLWCDWGKCCELGVETACREYENIVFRNCDILRGGCAALDISNGDCAEIHHVTFADIRVEYNLHDTREVHQRTEDMVYEEQDSVAIPTLLLIRNSPWRTPRSMKIWGLPPLTDKIDLRGIRSRNVHDVSVKGIHVFYEEGLPLTEGRPEIKFSIEHQEETEAFYNIEISEISVNGKAYEAPEP